MSTTLWWKLAAVVPLIAVASCGGIAADHACTAIGGESGVVVQLNTVTGATYRLCVNTTCSTVASHEGGPLLLHLRLPDSIGPKPVTVRLTATTKTGTKPFVDTRTRVTLQKSEPNGHDCGPTLYNRALTYDPARGLR